MQNQISTSSTSVVRWVSPLLFLAILVFGFYALQAIPLRVIPIFIIILTGVLLLGGVTTVAAIRVQNVWLCDEGLIGSRCGLIPWSKIQAIRQRKYPNGLPIEVSYTVDDSILMKCFFWPSKTLMLKEGDEYAPFKELVKRWEKELAKCDQVVGSRKLTDCSNWLRLGKEISPCLSTDAAETK